jgi:regulator of sirC expression with transglutaminase-like and TPR domain
MPETSSAIRERLTAILSRDDDQIDLAEASLLLATEAYPRCDVGLYLERLDRFADQARERVEGASGARALIAGLNQTIFDDLGFRGNREHYFDPRNSYLNEVIDRRLGIPITLTIVYIEIARRIGFEVQGVSFPAHFIARHDDESADIFIDVFNSGRVMDVAGCDQFLRELSGGRTELRPEHLQPATARQILTRMLNNLLGIYSKADHRRALQIVEQLLIINPGTPAHIRDRGLLLSRLGATREAIDAFDTYLELAPDAADAELIREQLRTMKQQMAKWN